MSEQVQDVPAHQKHKHGLDLLDFFCQGWRPHALIFFVLLLCALPGFVALQPLDRDESRFVQATTQMFETGDFIRISFQDEPRNKKPIGIHWLQAATAGPLDGANTRTIQTFRIPSLLGAGLAAFCVFQIGALLYSRRIGLIAGIAIACGLLLSTEAGIAKTDAALAGFTALAYLGLAKLRQGPEAKTSWAPWALWVGLGMAALIKGPIGPLLVILSGLMLILWERDLGWVRRALHWPSMLLAAAIVLPWYIAIWQATNGQFFFDAVGQDLAPKLSGQSENKSVPPGAHLLLSPIIFWPGSILIPLALWTAWRDRKDGRVRYLLAWLVPGWLMFEAAPAKLAHYTLPVHGAVLLLGAVGLLNGGWQKAWLRWSSIVILAFGTLIMAALPPVLAADVAEGTQTIALQASIAIGVAGLAALGLVIARSRFAAAGLIGAAMIASLAIKGVFVPSIPQLDLSQKVSSALVKEGLHPRLSPGQPGPLIGAGYQEPSLIFLTRSDSALSSVAAAAAAAKPGVGIVVNADLQFEAPLIAALEEKGYRVEWRGSPIAGLNYSKGDEVTLKIGKVIPKPVDIQANGPQR
ncbi:glycosyltransferase family 39 protein [Aquidulcibacter sp.]|uniref:ArnT family glycosyltransferase n=1 Tax=Aquidulcibacter sp. TaxID=2052990 RepID=UPI0025C1B08E|nr:glycosyltransferase family 39 protein [Aquidulcibacter sp.]MCA3692415.1 glycosyltransferase family 39 protein [Aquidulcibacter sp.]